jgi:hypothetical protein
MLDGFEVFGPSVPCLMDLGLARSTDLGDARDAAG